MEMKENNTDLKIKMEKLDQYSRYKTYLLISGILPVPPIKKKKKKKKKNMEKSQIQYCGFVECEILTNQRKPSMTKAKPFKNWTQT